eukprot:745654-Hanusia_phi.AAC.3
MGSRGSGARLGRRVPCGWVHLFAYVEGWFRGVGHSIIISGWYEPGGVMKVFENDFSRNRAIPAKVT